MSLGYSWQVEKNLTRLIKFLMVCLFLFLGESHDEKEVHDGPVPWCRRNQLTFLAEQVSHHPPSELIKYTYT